jgi:hypothetical protein
MAKGAKKSAKKSAKKNVAKEFKAKAAKIVKKHAPKAKKEKGHIPLALLEKRYGKL